MLLQTCIVKECLLAWMITFFESCVNLHFYILWVIIAILLGHLQYYYWTPFHSLRNTIEIKIEGNTIAIILYPALAYRVFR